MSRDAEFFGGDPRSRVLKLRIWRLTLARLASEESERYPPTHETLPYEFETETSLVVSPAFTSLPRRASVKSGCAVSMRLDPWK